MNKKRIIKTVIRPDEIDTKMFGLALHDDRQFCGDCGSLLFYIKKMIGVVKEENDIQVWGNKDKTTYRLTDIGFEVYCAECGEMEEIYFQYQKDIVCNFDELDNAEKEEVDYWLAQYNQKKDYVPRYKTANTNILKRKIEEHERPKKTLKKF